MVNVILLTGCREHWVSSYPGYADKLATLREQSENRSQSSRRLSPSYIDDEVWEGWYDGKYPRLNSNDSDGMTRMRVKPGDPSRVQTSLGVTIDAVVMAKAVAMIQRKETPPAIRSSVGTYSCSSDAPVGADDHVFTYGCHRVRLSEAKRVLTQIITSQ